MVSAMKRRDPATAEKHVMRDRADSAGQFEALYTAHYKAIAGYVRRRVAAHEADDVIAQVFAIAWRRFYEVPDPPGDRLWLFGVARNSVAGQHRSERRRLRLQARLSQDVVTATSMAPAPDPSCEQVRAAINTLRPRDREVLQLVLWDELSHQDAAAVLGCSPNAFELRYRRARNAVRDAVIADRAPPDRPRTTHRTPQTSRTEPS
jgi:RNA polymerase sigma-70 factor (ECF subfamily)